MAACVSECFSTKHSTGVVTRHRALSLGSEAIQKRLCRITEDASASALDSALLSSHAIEISPFSEATTAVSPSPDSRPPSPSRTLQPPGARDAPAQQAVSLAIALPPQLPAGVAAAKDEPASAAEDKGMQGSHVELQIGGDMAPQIIPAAQAVTGSTEASGAAAPQDAQGSDQVNSTTQH